MSISSKQKNPADLTKGEIDEGGDWVELEIREVAENPVGFMFKSLVIVRKGKLAYTLMAVESNDKDIFNLGEQGEQMYIAMEKMPRCLMSTH